MSEPITPGQWETFWDEYSRSFSVAASAREAGFDPSRVWHRINPKDKEHDPTFAEHFHEISRGAAAAAQDVIFEIMQNPEEKASDRLRAAEFVARRLGKYLGLADDFRLPEGAGPVTINATIRQEFRVAMNRIARGELEEGDRDALDAVVVGEEGEDGDGVPAAN